MSSTHVTVRRGNACRSRRAAAGRRYGEIVGMTPMASVPARRDEDAPPVALEERRGDRALELGDLGGERGLRDVAPLGGAAKRELLRDGHRVLELAEGERVGRGRHADHHRLSG